MGRDKICPYSVILSRGEESCNALDEPNVSGKRVFKCPPDKSGSLGGLTPAELDVVWLRALLRRKSALRADNAPVGAEGTSKCRIHSVLASANTTPFSGSTMSAARCAPTNEQVFLPV